jgi:hypothetical protein
MKRYVVFYVLFLLVGLAVVPAHATLLTPGGTVSPGSAATGSNSSTVSTLKTSFYFPNGCNTDPILGNAPIVGPSGTLVADTCILQRSDFPSHLVADVREVVFQESGTGLLDFFFQLQIVSAVNPSTNQLADMFVAPFNGFTMNVLNATNVSMLGGSPGTGSGANDAAISAHSGVGVGSAPEPQCQSAGNGCITWSYSPGLAFPGETVTFEIATNATNFAPGIMGFDVTNGGSMDSIRAFVPAPEPVSIVLLGTILALGAFFVRRRQSAKNHLSVG